VSRQQRRPIVLADAGDFEAVPLLEISQRLPHLRGRPALQGRFDPTDGLRRIAEEITGNRRAATAAFVQLEIGPEQSSLGLVHTVDYPNPGPDPHLAFRSAAPALDQPLLAHHGGAERAHALAELRIDRRGFEGAQEPSKLIDQERIEALLAPGGRTGIAQLAAQGR